MNSLVVKLPATLPETYIALVGAPRTVNSALVPLEACRQAIADLNAALEPCADGDALKVTELLLGSYPRHAVADPEIYTRAMKSVLARYPRSIGFAAVDALTLKCKFMPTRAELREELEALAEPVRLALASARWMAKEHARRQAEADNERAIEASKAAFREKHGGKSPLEVLGPMFSAEEPTTTTTTEDD